MGTPRERMIIQYRNSFDPPLSTDETSKRMEGELRGTRDGYRSSLKRIDSQIAELQQERTRVARYLEGAEEQLKEFTG